MYLAKFIPKISLIAGFSPTPQRTLPTTEQSTMSTIPKLTPVDCSNKQKSHYLGNKPSRGRALELYEVTEAYINLARELNDRIRDLERELENAADKATYEDEIQSLKKKLRETIDEYEGKLSQLTADSSEWKKVYDKVEDIVTNDVNLGNADDFFNAYDSAIDFEDKNKAAIGEIQKALADHKFSSITELIDEYEDFKGTTPNLKVHYDAVQKELEDRKISDFPELLKSFDSRVLKIKEKNKQLHAKGVEVGELQDENEKLKLKIAELKSKFASAPSGPIPTSPTKIAKIPKVAAKPVPVIKLPKDCEEYSKTDDMEKLIDLVIKIEEANGKPDPRGEQRNYLRDYCDEGMLIEKLRTAGVKEKP